MVGHWIFLGVVGGYVSSSVLLLFFPTIIHKKKKLHFRPKHISHRGGAGERLENTLSAFDNATVNDTDMFEIDVQLTKDGQVVISHDDNLNRVSGVNNSISDLNYDDLPPLLEELQVTFTNERTVKGNGGEDEKIVLLKTVLEKFPNTPLNIDTKLNDDVIKPTIDLIHQYNRQHNIVMANMRSEAIDKIHKMDPDLLLGVSIKRMGLILFLFYTGLLPFIPLKESFLQIPLPEILLLNKKMPVPKWAVRLMQCLIMRNVLFRHLQKRGMQVHIFVCNEEKDFDKCYDEYKADAVMTDYPTKLRRYLLSVEDRKENDPLISE